ncbi:amino acid permease [Conexibacter sp. SYSU D00693]|uniref:amino acid permease n=1 Tax=Conexibacter sp. SYSU D00693 TaxID=2812560 RepID=UPI00196BAE86|nr:amino acid permease [Conexibacter sp. SYSU D00693]
MRPPSRAADERPRLKRSMGLWMATALVVGNMIGSGVFLLPASLADAAGPISILGWVFTGAGAMLLAWVFAGLGRSFPRTGGPYAYARRAFGDFAGFQTAWGYWIAVWAGNAAIAVAFVGYLAVFWPALGDDQLLAALVGIAVIWLVTAINVLGTKPSGQVQVVTTVLKFVPLAVIALVGIFFVDSANFEPFAPHGEGAAISSAATLTLWAFIGLESATVPAEEVKDPERTIPRATMIGTALATLVYVVATVAIMGIIPADELAQSTSPFADAAGQVFGGGWDKAIALVALVSTFGALNGWILLQGRVPLAAAEDGLFPPQFAKVHGERRTPVFGLVVSSVLVTALMLMNYTKGLVDAFTFVILLATLTTLVPYAYSAAAQVHLMVTDRASFVGRHLLRDGVVATLAFAYSVWAIAGAGQDVIAKGFVLLLCGIPVYVGVRWWNQRSAPAAVDGGQRIVRAEALVAVGVEAKDPALTTGEEAPHAR